MGGVRMRSLAAAALGACLLVLAAIAVADSPRSDVILGGSSPQIVYHAESAPNRPDGTSRIIAGNIHIRSERGARGGLAGECDPDPRAGAHVRPDDIGCEWQRPAGSGEDFMDFNRAIQQDFPEEAGGVASDTDTSPNQAFTPVATDTRERFNGRGGFDRDGNLFIDEGHEVLDDEDLNFRLSGVQVFQYLAPQGNPNNRWRRLCGLGRVDELDNNAPIAAPFALQQMRPFVVQIWDADWKDPSDQDGGNQDYFIIDVFAQGATINFESCRALPPGVTAPPVGAGPPSAPAPGQPGQPAVTPEGEPLVLGEQIVAGQARLRGPRRCVNRTFTAVVAGRQIRRVVFMVDGRRIGTVTQPNSRGQFTIRINPRRFARGVHRIRARVTFVRGAGRSVSRSVAFQRCPRPAQRVAPRFTG